LDSISFLEIEKNHTERGLVSRESGGVDC
jgi:hypothetical protein